MLSALGYDVHMDNNGDAEGNFTLVALGMDLEQGEIEMTITLTTLGGHCQTGSLGLFPIGDFVLGPTSEGAISSSLPSLRLAKGKRIRWPNGRAPRAVPACGFQVRMSAPRIC